MTAETAPDPRAGGTPPWVVRSLIGAGVAIMRWWRRLTRLWQRSIQLRVITATLVLSVAVVSLLGITLMQQVTDGLVDQRRAAAVAHAEAGLFTVQEAVNAALPGERPPLRKIVNDQAARSSEDGLAVMLLSDVATDFCSLPCTITTESVPTDLRDAVASTPSIFSTYTGIERTDTDTVEPGIVVGGQIVSDGDQYGLYYLFPLTEQEETLAVVWTALATAGLLLVLLLGAIAGLVTRQVVTPVRMAAQIAGRFSAGKLSERMVIRSKDDIAKLASSFNQMAGSLQNKIGELEELSRLQRQFASDVSHELRTPLTTVRMAADVLHESRDRFDPEVQRAAELLQAQLDRFEGLLTDLLEISRFDAGVAVLNAEPTDLRELVFQVADSAAPLAARRGSNVVVDAPADRCDVEIDSRRIERVLRNLVVNAIEHGEGRAVVVRVAADDHAAAVTVRDHGVGLKPGESSLVFHRFWRADPARARSTGGTGLGLAISLEDARLHGGWLQAWGEPGAGAQFRLTVPRSVGTELTSSPLPLMPEDASDARITGVGSPYRRVSPNVRSGTPGPAASDDIAVPLEDVTTAPDGTGTDAARRESPDRAAEVTGA